MKLKLNLGCGVHYAEGWTNVDRYPVGEIDERQRIDVVANILRLPFRSATAERIYLGHAIEHLHPEYEVIPALREIRRVLARNGQLMVVGPDIERAEAEWSGVVDSIKTFNEGSSPAGVLHEWAPTEADALAFCQKVFAKAKAIPVAEVPEEWPIVDRVGWQFAIHCPR